MNTIPAARSRISLRCSSWSLVQTFAPSPNSVPLATAIAASISGTRYRAATGPKTSSRCTRICAVMSASTVGGAAPDRPGFYYPPTVLADITAQMRVHREEVFGPVATLYRVPDIDAAIAVANGTEFGLGANVWTSDQKEQRRLIRDLAAGMVFINGNVTSYPQLPFGGVKNSGHGRELSVHGIREFCNAKAVWIRGQGDR